MNEQRIREIAEQSSYHAENSVDYYSGIVDGLTWEAKILKARDLKFAELIVRECAQVIQAQNDIENYLDSWDHGFVAGLATAIDAIEQHFEVKS